MSRCLESLPGFQGFQPDTEMRKERSLLVHCTVCQGMTASERPNGQTAKCWCSVTAMKNFRVEKDGCKWIRKDCSPSVAHRPMAQKPMARMAAQGGVLGRESA